MPSTRTSRLLSSTSSFDYLPSNVHSREASDSSESYSSLYDDTSSEDEQIVWSFSDISSGAVSPAFRSQRALSPGVFSEEEFIVLSRPRSPSRYQSLAASGTAASRIDATSIDALSHTFADLSVRNSRSRKPSGGSKATRKTSTTQPEPSPSTPSPKKRQRKKRAPATPAKPTPAPATQPSPTKKGKKPTVASTAPGLVSKKADAPKALKSKRTKNTAVAKVENSSDPGFPIVDDVSEVGDLKSGYEEAVQYVTYALTTDTPRKNSDLTLLQALIIELGLCPAPNSFNGLQSESLPRSLRAAKALLKSRVFLNVRDYLAVRHKGLDALRSVMHPNRKALIKDIRGGGRKTGRKVPVELVKESGLGVFLVTCYQ